MSQPEISPKREFNPLYSFFILTLLTPVIFLLICTPYLIRERKSALENRCKLTLKSIGTAQLSYSQSTVTNCYGTWDDLKAADWLPAGFPRSDLIDNYNISTFKVEPPSVAFNGLPAFDSTFTIIAIPSVLRHELRTFAIRDDQILRVWIGDDSHFNGKDDGLTVNRNWQPIR